MTFREKFIWEVSILKDQLPSLLAMLIFLMGTGVLAVLPFLLLFFSL